MIYGWDISTTTIGVSRFDNSGSYIDSKYFCPVVKSLYEKALDVDKLFVIPLLGMNPLSVLYREDDRHFIEDRLGGFSFGKTSAQTLMKLAAFNAMVSYMIINFYGDVNFVVHIHPSTVKAIVKRLGLIIPKGENKKKLTLDFVVKREPTFPLELNKNGNPKLHCYDEADSYITGLAGIEKWTKKES